jgi:Tfp pilus assembly protein FimT
MKRFSKQPAFTLAEMVIFLIVLSIIMGIGIPGIFSTQKHARFDQAVDVVVGMIQDARAMAFSGRELEIGADTCIANEYYVQFEDNVVSIFAEVSECTLTDDELIETTELHADIEITSSVDKIIYSNPYATVSFDPDTTSATIQVESLSEGFTEEITISEQVGMPEVD